MELYNLEAPEEYQPVWQEMKELIAELMDFERNPREHGEIEQHLMMRSHDLMRAVMQGYLDRQAKKEERREYVIGVEGTVRPHTRERCRSLMTVFGELQVHRLGYSDRGTDSVFPLDAQLNLPLEQYSHGIQERVGEMVADASYEAAVEHIKNHTGGHVPKRQAEKIAQGLAVDFDEFYRQRESPAKETPKPEELLEVISIDGKGIVMRHEDLREETQRRAEQSSHKLQGRLSRGEKHNRKRMATVATVYEIEPHYRKAEEIMDPEAPRPVAPKPIDKRVWASVEQSMSEVLDEAFAEAKRRDPSGKRSLIMLVDGLTEQLRQVYAAIKRHGRNVIVIQDFVHVLEYLWDATWCLHEEGDPKAEQWVREHATEILRGKSSEVAAGMRRSATLRGLSQAKREPLDKCAEYLLKNRERLNYAQALGNGWPIATGVIEGVCRHLVKQRMEVTGARWSLQGAEAILRLRALRMNGHLYDYFAFHRRQERLRNYPEGRLAA
jgi:triphosphoribosyl-dephospho-CoA synthetase